MTPIQVTRSNNESMKRLNGPTCHVTGKHPEEIGAESWTLTPKQNSSDHVSDHHDPVIGLSPFAELGFIESFVLKRWVVANQPHVLFHSPLHAPHQKPLANLQHKDPARLNPLDTWIIDNNIAVANVTGRVNVVDIMNMIRKQTSLLDGVLREQSLTVFRCVSPFNI